jgi:hypothetical protein
MTMSDLHVRIRVVHEKPGFNDRWVHTHSVVVPPDYTDADLEPFILHEMDKAVAGHQREHFERARSADIIAQYDRRMTVIEQMLANAPHNLRRAAVVLAVLRVMHMDADALFAEFGSEEAGN